VLGSNLPDVISAIIAAYSMFFSANYELLQTVVDEAEKKKLENSEHRSAVYCHWFTQELKF